MTRSETHKAAIDGQLQSETFYLGEKGDEIANYSHN